MEQIDLVVFGAEGVMETGGIINKVSDNFFFVNNGFVTSYQVSLREISDFQFSGKNYPKKT